jgi:hypothetical protein
MRDTVFGTAADYHELNAGVHRKPSKNLAAPALVRHLAFWTNVKREKTDSEEEGSEERPDQIKDKLDSFIRTLCRAISGLDDKVKVMPAVSKFFLLFNSYCDETSFDVVEGPLTARQQDIFTSTRRAILLKFKWKKLDVAIRFEVHTEYFSISTFVEFDRDRTGRRYSDLRELNKNTARIIKYFESGDTTVSAQINRYFFQKFWEDYEAMVLSEPSVKALSEDDAFQHVFADFRGFIFSERAIEFTSDEAALGPGKSPQWGRDAKKKFLPLVQDPDAAKKQRYECAVNYVLDGRAFYMSTLAPQMPSMPLAERIPLEFIVYANQRPRNSKTVINRWQLGRLVDRLLLLGTMRLCALRDVQLLHEAGRELGKLDESTQKAREAIAAIEARVNVTKDSRVARLKQHRAAVSNKKPVPAGGTETSDEEVMDLIGKAHTKLNNITGEFLKKTGSGLLYRIERSRYYVQRFDDNVKLLRIKRVEGDQPYDQFIKRRLGSEFDFIDRLGIRYERATRNMVTLDQNYLAMKANKIDEDIHTIQKWGEVVLLAVLVPYYVTHLVVLIFGEEFAPVVAANIWMLFIAIAFANFFKIWKHATLWRTVLAIVVAGLIIDLGLVPVEHLLLNYQEARQAHGPLKVSADILKTQQEILAAENDLKTSIDKGADWLRQLLEAQQPRSSTAPARANEPGSSSTPPP